MILEHALACRFLACRAPSDSQKLAAPSNAPLSLITGVHVAVGVFCSCDIRSRPRSTRLAPVPRRAGVPQQLLTGSHVCRSSDAPACTKCHHQSCGVCNAGPDARHRIEEHRARAMGMQALHRNAAPAVAPAAWMQQDTLQQALMEQHSTAAASTPARSCSTSAPTSHTSAGSTSTTCPVIHPAPTPSCTM